MSGFLLHRRGALAAIAGALALASIGAAEAAGLSGADRAEIRRVIEAQLAAFQADDASAAFGFASRTIQTRFRDADTFLAMVRAHYRPVYRPAAYRFLDALADGGEVVQPVLITDQRGDTVLALYPMVKDAAGRWRIDGCRLVDPPGVGA